MAVTLIGEIVNSCDATTGFNAGNISGDDDFVEGTGAIGLKVSNATSEMYTTTLGATAPYDFSSSGGEDGDHIILWVNTKTPVNATSGLRIVVGNGTDRGHWYVIPTGFYKGGFITAVVDTARDFDVIQAGTWTTTGNPAQLSNVTEMGGAFTTITSIMGSFNNTQIDQITIGQGVRVDAGTVGTPNTFETVRVADEDTAFYGWWASSVGAIVGKGKLFIGPSTGSATSVFNDESFAVIFADQRVAADFYEINTRGAGTDVTWNLGNISSADSSSVRWGLTVQSDTNTFTDTNSVLSGGGALVLNANSTLTGTVMVDCTSLTTNGATLDSVSVLEANTAADEAFIIGDDLADYTDCVFESKGTGHAIDLGTITASASMAWSNTDSGYAATDGSTGNETILVSVNSGQTLTINVGAGYSTPTVNNTGLGTVTKVISPVTTAITVKDTSGTAIDGARVLVWVTDNTNYFFEATVSITGTGTTATVTHTAHGLITGDNVIIAGVSNDDNYNGVFSVTVTGANTYTYTTNETIVTSPATGTIEATMVVINELSAVTTGLADDTRSWSAAQPIAGRVRKSTSSPYYQQGTVSGSISTTNGFTATVQMVGDE